ncbi:calmodulin-alpha-like [Thomomys bottae]
MAEKLSKEEKEELHQAFSRFDKNGDGKINTEELGEVMKAVGQNLTEAELKELIARLDTDGDGTISFQEFLTAVAKRMKGGATESELRSVFSAFDENGDGHISVEELKQAMAQLGEELSQEDLDAMIREADLDKDGQVNYEEFVAIFSQK